MECQAWPTPCKVGSYGLDLCGGVLSVGTESLCLVKKEQQSTQNYYVCVGVIW